LDFIVIPVQYGLIWNLSVAPVWKTGIDPLFVTYVAVTLIFGLAAVPAFRRLASVTGDMHLADESASGFEG